VNVMTIKIEKMLKLFKTIKFPVFHLFHSTNGQKLYDQTIRHETNINHELYQHNCQYVKMIEKMNKQQLFDYYENKKIGDVLKYQL
jgi:hypothetical protein